MSTSRRTLLNLALAGIGAVLLLVTIRGVGWSAVQSSVADIGWWYLAIVALGGVRFAARTRAWLACLDGEPLTFRRAFSATLSGDALGNVTPLGVFASEPAKVFFVQDRLATVGAVASVATENVFYIASVLVMLTAGGLTFVSVANLPLALRLVVQAVLAAALVAGVIGVWVARRRPALLSRVAHMVAHRTGRAASAPDRLSEIERHVYAALNWPFPRLLQVALWEATFHMVAVAEVLLVLRLLPLGKEVTLLEAFVLETTGRLIVVAFKFVPYRLGVDEAGSAVVARALALNPTLGVTLALVRRIRVLAWNAVGLALLALTRQSREVSPPGPR